MHIKVKAHPDSKKEAVKKISAERLSICVREPAEDNRANARILEIVRSLYPKSKVRMISGHRAAHKIFEVTE